MSYKLIFILNLIFTVAIACLVLLVTFIDNSDKIRDKSKSWFKSFTKYGKKILLINFIIIILLAFQYILGEQKDKTSCIDPVLFCSSFSFIEEKDSTNLYELTILSSDASTTSFDISCTSYRADNTVVRKVPEKDLLLEENDKLPINGTETFYFEFKKKGLKSMHLYYFKISGTYKSLNKSKTFHINEYYYYNFKDQIFRRLRYNSPEVKIMEEMEKTNAKTYTKG